MSFNLKCSREEAAKITLDEYSEKYCKRNNINGTNLAERKDTYNLTNSTDINEDNNMAVDVEPKPLNIRRFNHKNYWKNRKRNNNQNNYNNQSRQHNQVAVPHNRQRKTRWNLPQPYQQLLNNYNTLTKHLPSLLDIRTSLPGNLCSYNVNNPNSTLVETKNSARASVDQMSSLADQLLKKFDTLYEIRQSIKVEQEKKTKYNIPIQKEIASIQNKTLFVKCPNSEVVTSDGPGIDVHMPVHSTNLSNNMRFA